MNIVPAHPSDVFVWPCGTWCFREDAHEFTHKSDDFLILPAESTEAEDFLVQEYAT